MSCSYELVGKDHRSLGCFTFVGRNVTVTGRLARGCSVPFDGLIETRSGYFAVFANLNVIGSSPMLDRSTSCDVHEPTTTDPKAIDGGRRRSCEKHLQRNRAPSAMLLIWLFGRSYTCVHSQGIH